MSFHYYYNVKLNCSKYAEFLELELLRLGNLNLSALNAIRTRYENEVDGNDIFEESEEGYDEEEDFPYRNSEMNRRRDGNGNDHDDEEGRGTYQGPYHPKSSLRPPSTKKLSTFTYLNNPKRTNTLEQQTPERMSSQRFTATDNDNHYNGTSFNLDMNK